MLRTTMLFAVAATVLLAVGPSTAQTVMRIAPRLANAPNAAGVTPDPTAILQSRLTRLENRVNALESTVGKVQPQVTYRCVAPSTSGNSLGVTEDCSPYVCGQIDGRCRNTARTSDDCVTGYLWVAGDHCQHQ